MHGNTVSASGYKTRPFDLILHLVIFQDRAGEQFWEEQHEQQKHAPIGDISQVARHGLGDVEMYPGLQQRGIQGRHHRFCEPTRCSDG